MNRIVFLLAAIGVCGGASAISALDVEPFPTTELLEMQGDIASQLVAGVDRFLLQETEKSVERRARHWKRDFTSAEAYDKSVEPNRQRLAHMLGVRDARVPFEGFELVGTTERPALVGRGEGYEIYAVRWPAFGDVHGEGLLLVPADGGRANGNIVAIPDADQTPEMLVGLEPGVPPESQFARRLAQAGGCRVLVPALINREATHGRLSNREFLYRSAFELGRHLIGYEVQKVLAAVDWFVKDSKEGDSRIGVIGWGEGGMLALYAGALDPRIDSVCVSGSFGSMEDLWQEPIYRNVFGLLDEFGGAELASMVVPRNLIIEAAKGPEVVVPPGTGGGPGRLTTRPVAEVRREFERARRLVAGFDPSPISLLVSGEGAGPYGSREALAAFLRSIVLAGGAADFDFDDAAPENFRSDFDPKIRHASQMHEIDRHSQWLLRESPYVRQQFLSKLDTKSIEKYEETVEWYRRFFYDEVIGRFDQAPLPFNIRSRKAYDAETWVGYEVVMDVFPDVIAYGILQLPRDLRKGERRPIVVCQHGLEGRPQNVIEGDNGAYHDFATRLVERGFITFSPQNLYIFEDRFRTLQRKGNPLKKTLYSVIVPQHQQIVDWLKTLPYVDSERIAFYGLSYGGKTAMRVPPLVTDYCLSICSADFNEWVDKNASTRNPHSYVGSGEYEIFEFDLGSTFNYMEMAALIAPRPFMVERGHFDGVASDETVAYEFAKVRNLYQARLGIGERCEIEFFVGPHTINGKGTYDFLHRHLDWPKR